MITLITGASGFAGQHLLRLLINETDDRLVALSNRNMPSPVNRRIDHCKVDLLDFNAVKAVLETHKPVRIYHLAGIVGIGSLRHNPLPAYNVNIIGTANLFEAIRQLELDVEVLNVGSSEEYGIVFRDSMPIDENVALNPHNGYGLSKCLQEEMARHYMEHYDIPVIFVRTFHYMGPGQPVGFLFPDIISQVIEIRENRGDVLKTGTLSVKRDFTDIRDVVRAYRLLMHAGGKFGEVYNVCSGHARSIRDFVELMIKQTGANIQIEVDPKKVRPADVPLFQGNHDKLTRTTGWLPEITLENSVSDIFSYMDREKHND